MLPGRFSLFGGGDSRLVDNNSSKGEELLPTLKVETDRQVYRPGDPVIVTIQISNPSNAYSFLMERLSFEIKGIEKLDTQWFATQKPLPGSKQRRGENVFLDSSTPILVANQIVNAGACKSCMPPSSTLKDSAFLMSPLTAFLGVVKNCSPSLLLGHVMQKDCFIFDVVRTLLPNIIPPSYKGSNIRYLYYVKSAATGGWLILENGQSRSGSTNDVTDLEVRIPLQIWVNQKSSGFPMDDDIVPLTAVQQDVFWKEMDGDADWVRANDIYDGVEEGYDSSRDDISSVSSYNPMKENLYKGFGSSLSLRSSSARSLTKDAFALEGHRTSLSSNMALPRLSVAEVLSDSGAGPALPNNNSFSKQMSYQPRSHLPWSPQVSNKSSESHFPQRMMQESRLHRKLEPLNLYHTFSAAEGFVRGRSYNIRLDDQVLLKFSPKNSDSTYYFSDMIGGTLTFFHVEGARRCLEISITLETSETINRRFVHPSRRNSPTITKVQSDHHEVVADLVQTSFLFSIPMDGPMTFSTPHVSVQWVLRFEFYTTPKHVDWTKYEHPLLIEGREKTEWVLPITVHAPPPRTPASGSRNERLFSLDPLWVHN